MNGPIQTGASTVAAKQDKHSQLNGAVDRLETVERSICELLARIRGDDIPENNKISEIGYGTNLSATLSGSPEKIQSFCDRVNALVSEIHESLF